MEATELFSNLAGLKISAATFSSIVLVIALGIFIKRRTSSSHILLSKLWIIFFGKEQCTNEKIREFLAERSALMQFRFTTGIKTRSVKQTSSVITWTIVHDEDIAEVYNCGSYFDLEKPGLKSENFLPKRGFEVAMFLIAILTGISVFIGVILIVPNLAFLKMKASGTNFILSEKFVRTWSSPGFPLSACTVGTEKISPSSGFTTQDIKSICESVKSNEIPTFVKNAVLEQRITLAPFLTSFLILFRETCREFIRARAARRMNARLRQRR